MVTQESLERNSQNIQIFGRIFKIGNTRFYNKTIRSLPAILFPYLQTQRQNYKSVPKT